jgi:hypothetical protein
VHLSHDDEQHAVPHSLESLGDGVVAAVKEVLEVLSGLPIVLLAVLQLAQSTRACSSDTNNRR